MPAKVSKQTAIEDLKRYVVQKTVQLAATTDSTTRYYLDQDIDSLVAMTSSLEKELAEDVRKGVDVPINWIKMSSDSA